MTQSEIHPSAIIEQGADIAPGCKIGPFAYVGADVVIEQGVELKSHAVVTGNTRIGAESTIFSFAVVGEVPQDLKFSGEESRLEIGARARIREHVTVNTGTEGGGNVTRIGDDCLLMAGCHVAHDVQIGNRVIVVNNTAIAGHCLIGDDVIIGGLSGIHQFVRIGHGAMIGAMSMVAQDVVPFGLVQSPRAKLDGLNLVGMKRRGMDRKDIKALRDAVQRFRDRDGSFHDEAEKMASETDNQYVQEMMAFILGESDRSFLTPE